MKALIEKIKRMHVLAIMASIGLMLFTGGALYDFVNTVPHAAMWVGGSLVILAGFAGITE